MSLYDLFEQIEAMPIGVAIRDSSWLFAAIEAGHLLALALLGGAVLIINLTVLGVALKAPAAQVEREARPWMRLALLGLFATGIPLFMSEPLKLYDRPIFWVKMAALVAALTVTFLIHHPMIRRGGEGVLVRLMAVATMALWLLVAFSGRWIGFS